MTTIFNGWQVTQRIKKETKGKTRYKLRLEDMSATHKLSLEITEDQYNQYKIRDQLPAGLIKNMALDLAEKNKRETANGTKLKLTFTDEDQAAKLKIDADEVEYDKRDIGDHLEMIEPLYQAKLDEGAKP
jgi:hypothetical protein